MQCIVGLKLNHVSKSGPWCINRSNKWTITDRITNPNHHPVLYEMDRDYKVFNLLIRVLD